MPSTLATSPSARPLGVLKATLYTTAAAMLIATVYSLVMWFIPFVNVLTILAAPAFGMFVAHAAERGCEVGRVRHRGVAYAILAFALTVGFYTAWVVWVAAVARDPETLLLGLHPGVLASLIAYLNVIGLWKVGDFSPTGSILWLLWIVEALLLYGVAFAAVRVPLENLLRRPFCRTCEGFIGRPEHLVHFGLGPDTRAEVADHVAARDWEYFAGLGRSEDEDNAHRLLLAKCACGRLQAATVERHTRDLGDYGDYSSLAKDAVLSDDEPERIAAAARLARPPYRAPS